MKTEISEFFEGAASATGIAVIIDVFRAFSLACYAFDGGVSRYIIAGSVDEAFSLKGKFPEALLVGERNERMIVGFDYGNSPTHILTADIKGATIIHCTTAGTTGVSLASKATEVITGSLVNAEAIARYIKAANHEKVSLVAMGYQGESEADEDMLCAQYIESLIEGSSLNPDHDLKNLQTGSGARFFLKENLYHSPPTDFYLCTMKNRFNFVLSAMRMPGGHTELIKVPV